MGRLTPECAALAAGAAAAGLAAKCRCDPPLRITRQTAARGLGTLVFAARAINVPVWSSSAPISSAAFCWLRLLGPSLAWTMAVVPALRRHPGRRGLAALGANVLNMALLPAGIVAVAAMHCCRLTRRGYRFLAQPRLSPSYSLRD
jgi:ABC-type Co2+ transport system permease subunit